jgi:hypothetical protein
MKLRLTLASAGIVIGMTGIASAQSDYNLCATAGCLYPQQTYAISTSSNEYRGDGAWGNYTAPAWDSSFLVINGATVPNQRVLYATEDFTAGVTYSFSFLAVDNYPVAAPVLQLVRRRHACGQCGDAYSAVRELLPERGRPVVDLYLVLHPDGWRVSRCRPSRHEPGI